MRVGPNIRGLVWYLQDGEWVLSPRKIRYPEGWYLVSPIMWEEETD